MLSLQNKKPLVYSHPLSHLITSMPYIDNYDSVPKSVINYMIKMESTTIETPFEEYLKDFPLPKTPFLDSKEFEELVKAAENRKKSNKKSLTIPVLNPNDKVSFEAVKKTIETGEQNIEYNFHKNPNLDITGKLGPLVLRQHISYIDKLREILNAKICVQKQQIEQLNAKRKYEQLEHKERLDTINDRVKMLLVAGQSARPSSQ